MKKIIYLISCIFLAVFVVNNSNNLFAQPFIDINDIDYHGEEMKSFADGVWTETYAAPDVSEFCKIIPEITADKSVTVFGLMQDITLAKANCGADPFTKHGVDGTKKKWQPNPLEIADVQCRDDFEDSFMDFVKTGDVNTNDLTTDASRVMAYMLSRLNPAALEDFKKLSWFGNKSAALYTNYQGVGLITPAYTLANINSVNGFWSKIDTWIATHSEQHVSITKNSGITYVLQQFDSTDTINMVATNYFKNMITKADQRLRGDKSGFILCTQSMADQYINELESKTGIPAAFEILQNGLSVIRRLGVSIYVDPSWDRLIKRLYDNGTTVDRPHRALYMTKNNFQVGINYEGSITKWSMWYDKYFKKVFTNGEYMLDTQIPEDYKYMAAF